jgi:hypothetical protein
MNAASKVFLALALLAASFGASAALIPTEFLGAPEIDPASAMSALTLLAGGLAVLWGRKPVTSPDTGRSRPAG